VVLGKWIATNPKVMILDSPTVGVDIGSKAEIYDYIQDLAAKGMGIILISDEIPEILANCNELLIMREGKIISHLDSKDLDSEGCNEQIYEIMNS